MIIGKEGRQITKEKAMEHIGGYCLALDMTARDLQDSLKQKGLPWAIAKGFDTGFV